MLIVHEYTHSIFNVSDEYYNANAVCSGVRSWPLCWHSNLGTTYGASYCTQMDHRQVQEDWRLQSVSHDWAPGIRGPVAYDCNGFVLWTNNAPMWDVVNIEAPYPLPYGLSPHTQKLGQMSSDPMIGSFSRLQ